MAAKHHNAGGKQQFRDRHVTLQENYVTHTAISNLLAQFNMNIFVAIGISKTL